MWSGSRDDVVMLKTRRGRAAGADALQHHRSIERAGLRRGLQIAAAAPQITMNGLTIACVILPG